MMNVTDDNDMECGDHHHKEKREKEFVKSGTKSPASVHTATTNAKRQEMPLSIKFFNISRRLYELALPKQSP